MSEDELVDVRRRTVAFIFQAFGLVPILTAAENVEVPLRLVQAEPTRARRAGRRRCSSSSGWRERAKHRPHELSGGEQQRVASPGRSRTGRGSSSPTSRPASSTPRPAT